MELSVEKEKVEELEKLLHDAVALLETSGMMHINLLNHAQPDKIRGGTYFETVVMGEYHMSITSLQKQFNELIGRCQVFGQS